MKDYEEGLIEIYIGYLRSSANRVVQDDELFSSVDDVISDALKQFRALKSSDPQANLSAFRSRIKYVGDRAHSSQPVFKRVFDYAYQQCPVDI